jgi:hypothetical protein
MHLNNTKIQISHADGSARFRFKGEPVNIVSQMIVSQCKKHRTGTVPWFRGLGAGLYRRRPEFDFSPFHLGICGVRRDAWTVFFSENIGFFPCHYYLCMLYTRSSVTLL